MESMSSEADQQAGAARALVSPSSVLPVVTAQTTAADLDQMAKTAEAASDFLKAISHPGRLMILCHLVSGRKSVTDLEDLLSSRQSAVSQQLARLRLEGLVRPCREGKTIYYSLADDRPRRVMEVVYELFCAQADKKSLDEKTQANKRE